MNNLIKADVLAVAILRKLGETNIEISKQDLLDAMECEYDLDFGRCSEAPCVSIRVSAKPDPGQGVLPLTEPARDPLGAKQLSACRNEWTDYLDGDAQYDAGRTLADCAERFPGRDRFLSGEE